MSDTLQPGSPRHPSSFPPGQDQPRSDTAPAHITPLSGAAPSPSVVLAPGARPLPDYQLVCLVGRGGFGEVWKAAGPGGFDVALKFICLGSQAGRVERRSLELMRNIRHPHLLPLFGAWQQGDFLIIAMELADRTLLDRLHEAQGQGLPGIPRDELLEYMREGAKGLDFLNEPQHPAEGGGLVGIQHKDIKPQNLLLVGGSVKVADFGLAKLLEHTVTSASGGLTPAYAAPEFLNGQATRWSDQYCLAVTYCHLRGGRLPFQGSAMQIMAGHMMHPPDLSMLTEEEHPAVARALAKKPEERWPNSRSFVEALSDAAGTRRMAQPRSATATEVPPTLTAWPALPSALPPTLSDSPVPSRWRKRAVAGAIVLLALALPALLLWAARGRPGPGASKPEAPPVEARRPPEARETPPAPEPPAPPASLSLAPIPAVTVVGGQSNVLEVRVERRGCEGPVRLKVEGLPDQVEVESVTVPAGQEVARLPVRAAEGAEESARSVRVLAQLGTLQAEQQVRVVVKARPALRLSLPGAVTLEAGHSKDVEVQLERRHCPGPVVLSLEGLPTGVTAGRGLIPPDASAGRVELIAAADAVGSSRGVRLLAVAPGVREEAQFQLTVRPDQAAQERVVGLPSIKDEGKFFSAETLDRANRMIRAIYREHHREVVVETFPALPADLEMKYKRLGKEKFFADWAGRRAQELGVNGLYVLICKKPGRLEVSVSHDTVAKAFTRADRGILVKQMLEKFRDKKFDEGLLEGIDFIESTLKAHAGQ